MTSSTSLRPRDTRSAASSRASAPLAQRGVPVSGFVPRAAELYGRPHSSGRASHADRPPRQHVQQSHYLRRLGQTDMLSGHFQCIGTGDEVIDRTRCHAGYDSLRSRSFDHATNKDRARLLRPPHQLPAAAISAAENALALKQGTCAYQQISPSRTVGRCGAWRPITVNRLTPSRASATVLR